MRLRRSLLAGLAAAAALVLAAPAASATDECWFIPILVPGTGQTNYPEAHYRAEWRLIGVDVSTPAPGQMVTTVSWTGPAEDVRLPFTILGAWGSRPSAVVTTAPWPGGPRVRELWGWAFERWYEVTVPGPVLDGFPMTQWPCPPGYNYIDYGAWAGAEGSAGEWCHLYGPPTTEMRRVPGEPVVVPPMYGIEEQCAVALPGPPLLPT